MVHPADPVTEKYFLDLAKRIAREMSELAKETRRVIKRMEQDTIAQQAMGQGIHRRSNTG